MGRIAFFLLAASLALPAQERGAGVQANTVYVSAQGAFESLPDTAILQFSVSAQDKTARAAYDHATRAVDQVREMLRSAAVDPGTAEFGSFQLRPLYDYRGSKRKITSYQVNCTVVLKLKDFSKAGPILDQISNLDVAEDISLNYSVENTETAKRRAVEAAMAKARGEAEVLARAGGRSLGDVVYASIDTQEHLRITSMANMSSLAELSSGISDMDKQRLPQPLPPPDAFTPQSVTVTATVYALFGLK